MADFSRIISTVVFDIQGREQLAKFIADLKKADKELTSLNTQLAKLKAGFAAAFDKMDKKAFADAIKSVQSQIEATNKQYKAQIDYVKQLRSELAKMNSETDKAFAKYASAFDKLKAVEAKTAQKSIVLDAKNENALLKAQSDKAKNEAALIRNEVAKAKSELLQAKFNEAQKIKQVSNTGATGGLIETLRSELKQIVSLRDKAKTELEVSKFGELITKKQAELNRLVVGSDIGIIQKLRTEIRNLNTQRDKAVKEVDISKIDEQISAKQKELSKLTAASKSTGGGIGGLLISGLAIGTGVASVEALIGAIKSLGSAVITTSSNFEAYEASLKNIFGSSQEAKESLDNLSELNKQLPGDLDTLVKAFIRLNDLGFKPTNQELIAISDFATRVPGKTIGNFVEAIADSVTYEQERLKEFGVTTKTVGDKIFFTFRNVTTEVEKSPEAIRKYLIGLGQLNGVQGQSAAVAATLTGQLSALSDNWTLLLKNIGEWTETFNKGVIQALNSFLDVVNEYLDTPLSEELRTERDDFNTLTEAIILAGDSTAVRTSLINEMKAAYPDLLKYIDLEKLSNEQLATVLNDVNNLYADRIGLQILKENLQDTQKELKNLQDRQKSLLKTFSTKLNIRIEEIAGIKDTAGQIEFLRKKIAELGQGGIKSVVNIKGESWLQNLLNPTTLGEAFGEYEKNIKRLSDITQDVAKQRVVLTEQEKEKQKSELEFSIKGLRSQIKTNEEKLKSDKTLTKEAKLNLAEQIRTDKIQLDILTKKLTLTEKVGLDAAQLQKEIAALEKSIAPKSETPKSNKDAEKVKKDNAERLEALTDAKDRLIDLLKTQEFELNKVVGGIGKSGLEALKSSLKAQADENLKEINDTFEDIKKTLKEKNVSDKDIQGLEGIVLQIRAVVNQRSLIEANDKINDYLKNQKDNLLKIYDDLEQLQSDRQIRILQENSDRTLQEDLRLIDLRKQQRISELQKQQKETIESVKKNFEGEETEIKNQIDAINEIYSTLINDETQKTIEENSKAVLSQIKKDLEKLNKDLEIQTTKINAKETQRIINLNDSYKQGLITKSEYEKQYSNIESEAQDERLQSEIDSIDEQISNINSGLDNARKSRTLSSKEEFEAQQQVFQLLAKRQLIKKQQSDKDLTEEEKKKKEQEEAQEKLRDKLVDAYQGITGLFSQINDIFYQKQIEQIDKSIALQQQRIDKARVLAEKGNAEALQREENLLRNLQQRRAEAVNRDKRINAVIQAGNTILTASYSLLAIAKAAAEGGAAAPITILSTIAAAAAGFGAIIGLVNAFTSAPEFAEGIDFVGKDQQKGRSNGGKDEYPAWLDKGERVTDKETNKKYSVIYDYIEKNKPDPKKLEQTLIGRPTFDVRAAKTAIKDDIDTKETVKVKRENELIKSNNEVVAAIEFMRMEIRNVLEQQPNYKQMKFLFEKMNKNENYKL